MDGPGFLPPFSFTLATAASPFGANRAQSNPGQPEAQAARVPGRAGNVADTIKFSLDFRVAGAMREVKTKGR